MKKKIILILLLAAFTFAGCEDNKAEFLDEYSVRTYFRNSGVEPLVLYKTGEDTQYTAVINKAGSDLQAAASVTVGVMNEVELSLYNENNGTNFTLLPAQCYQLDTEKILNFASSDTYKHFGVTLKTNEVEELQSTNPTLSYVVPLYITSPEKIINPEKDKVMIVPSVVVPSVYFVNAGLFEKGYSGSGEVITFECPISLPVKNQWTFDCLVEVDESLMNEYNAANKTKFKLLTDYEMVPSASFVPGVSQESIEVKVDFSKLACGSYMLPLKLSGTTNPNFATDAANDVCLLAITYRYPSVDLIASMLSTNAPYPGDSKSLLSNLLDSKVETYFYSLSSSAGGGDIPDHHLQVELAKELTDFQYFYTTRKENGAGAPKDMSICVSKDGVTFKEVSRLNSGLPTGGAEDYYSPTIHTSEPFKYLRLITKTNNSNKPYFIWSEFRLFGQ